MRLKERLILLLVPLFILSEALLVAIIFYLLQSPAEARGAWVDTAITGLIVTAGVGVACVSVVMIGSVAHSVTEPIEAMLRAIRGLAQGDRQTPIVIEESQCEVVELAEHLEDLRMDLARFEEAVGQKHAHEAIGKLASEVAHDLRTPLTTLKFGLAQLEEIERAFQDERVTAAVEMLRQSGDRLNVMADALLERYRRGDAVESARMDRTIIHVHPMLTQLIAEFRHHALGEGVEFDLVEGREACTVEGDLSGLQRAVSNLMKNALEAMAENVGEGSCPTLRVTADVEGPWSVITVRDNGKGMTPDLVQRILHGGISVGKIGGHGLGMQVVREVIEAHGGELSCVSTPDVGTEFIIRLPRDAAQDDSAVAAITTSSTGG